MTTKDQERKALEKIRKIVEEIGGRDSYIGMAFDGCFELAETNIENDWGCSMQDKVESLNKNCERWENRFTEMQTELAKSKANADHLQGIIDMYKEALTKKGNELLSIQEECSAANNMIEGLKAEIGGLKQEVTNGSQMIVSLKAKLFDLLYNEAV